MKAFLLAAMLALLAFAQVTQLAAAEPTPFNGTPHLIPGRIEAEEFDLGGEGVAYHGLGAFMTNVTVESWGLSTNIHPPIPRSRPDADIGIVRMNSFSPWGEQLALRQDEWVKYSVSCEEAGYYSIQIRTLGPPAYHCRAWPDCRDIYSGRAAQFYVALDGVSFGVQSATSAEVVLPRVWLTSGRHSLRVGAVFVDDLYPSACAPNAGDCAWDVWRYFTLPIDWIQVAPAATPLRAEFIAGNNWGFMDGIGVGALFREPKIVGEDATGSLIAFEEASHAFRRVQRDGTVTTLVGSPRTPGDGGPFIPNPPMKLVQVVPTTSQGPLVLATLGDRTNLIFQVTAEATATSLFSGTVIISNTSQVLDGLIIDTNTFGILRRLEPTADGALEAIVSYTWFELGGPPSWWPYETTRLARVRLSSAGVFEWVGHTSLGELAPAQSLGDGYSLLNGQIVQTNETSLGQVVFSDANLVSAYRAKDGTLWASDRSKIIRLVPDVPVNPANEPGVARNSVSISSNGRLNFALVGPPPGANAYSYLIELSGDLKIWHAVTEVTVLGNTGQSSGGYVTAQQPLTAIEVLVADEQRFFRATLQE